MESNNKFNDCYFFYYSTCIKGDHCPFRHEASALGCETMCSFWQQGKCHNERCNLRHMNLKKDRKSIPCYWENQPGGCRKPHCSFMHKESHVASDPIYPVKGTAELATKLVNQEWLNRQDQKVVRSNESDQSRGNEASNYINSPVDVNPFIVKFEEESDSESTPSPVKSQAPSVPSCKTYEEIRLQEIQEESAKYYSYEPDDYIGSTGGGKLKRTLSLSQARTVKLYSRVKEMPDNFQVQVLSLEEIRKKKRMQEVSKVESESSEEKISVQSEDFLKDAIKTLDQLKAKTSVKESSRTKRPAEEDEAVETSPAKRAKTTTEASPATRPIRLKRRPLDRTRLAEQTKVTNIDSTEVTKEFSLSPAEPKQSEQDTKDCLGLQHSHQSDVEIRLCDSSTDDNREDFIAKGDDSSGISLVKQSISDYDSLLNDNEDSYSSVGNDDILKDIDAILQQDPQG